MPRIQNSRSSFGEKLPRSAPEQKAPPAPVIDHHPVVGAALDVLEGLQQLAPHVGADGVLPLRPVEDDGDDVISSLDQQGFHRARLSTRAACSTPVSFVRGVQSVSTAATPPLRLRHRDRGLCGDRGDPAVGTDPSLSGPVEVRLIHPFQAQKTYLCPGCFQEIMPGTGHFVVVPSDAPDLRRHWHRPCWERRDRRRPGRG